MNQPRPNRPELVYAPYYETYIALVPQPDILPALQSQLDEFVSLGQQIPEIEAGVRHPPYTWTARQVIGHLIDTERIFGYRALRFARGDATPLPGFEQEPYVATGDFDRRTVLDLCAEFEALRRSHIHFFENLSDDAWARRGVASENEVNVRALAYMMVGHVRHHGSIVKKRLGLR